MAAGDVTVFDEALVPLTNGSWATTDQIAIQLITNATEPAVGQASPVLGTWTPATTDGPHVLDTLTNMVTEAGGTMTFDDTGATVVFAQGAYSTNCRWGIIYNEDQTSPLTDPAIAYIDLGANVDLSAGSLTITWDTLGIFTIS